MEINRMDNSRKPMLEGLKELYQLLDKKSLSQAHFLFLAVYVVALHTGFIPQNFFVNQLKSLFPLESWSTFHKKNVEICCSQPPTYEYDSPHETYFHERFSTNVKAEQDDALKSVLTAIVSGDFMMITLTPHHSTKLLGRSSCLSIGRYVISHSEDPRTVEACYQKLDQLRLQLRNEVFMPVRGDQLSCIGAFPHPSLTGIPRELRFRIYEYLLAARRVKLLKINKTLRAEINGWLGDE
ncbi:PREDICTED: protein nutcracker-like [Rhagoletis zephyria]|uniref:protein nutcracker-like n=1 Tax=Rhagoletis zephyria TaxID=28612 RepID=UPI0008115530|nr:PREDICTED: protein nutcracker-like [Rhagoletis zephyria]XP_017478702.1 PREDICTED: protein nutcracker-like [Rhagoletis zephyria]